MTRDIVKLTFVIVPVLWLAQAGRVFFPRDPWKSQPRTLRAIISAGRTWTRAPIVRAFGDQCFNELCRPTLRRRFRVPIIDTAELMQRSLLDLRSGVGNYSKFFPRRNYSASSRIQFVLSPTLYRTASMLKQCVAVAVENSESNSGVRSTGEFCTEILAPSK